jgi:hypothetical protein
MDAKDLHFAWQVFHLPKDGSSADEYEDAFAGQDSTGRFAVADGASESSFAACWARLLAHGFVESEGKPWREGTWLGPLRQLWAKEVDGRPLPWYAEEKRDLGAFATLVGVAFRSSPEADKEAIWRGLAVGDSCLFHTRRGRLRTAFPVKKSEGFNNRPRLIGSRGGPTGDEAGWQHTTGRCRRGDSFLLMTDALAAWFLEQNEQEQQPIGQLMQLLAADDPHGAFVPWVEERRARRTLRNDDVTLMIIDLV